MSGTTSGNNLQLHGLIMGAVSLEKDSVKRAPPGDFVYCFLFLRNPQNRVGLRFT